MCRPVPLSSTVDVQCQWTQCPGSGDSWPVANERRYYKPHVTDSVVREPLKRKFQVSRNFEAVENSDGAASALAADSTCAAQGQKQEFGTQSSFVHTTWLVYCPCLGVAANAWAARTAVATPDIVGRPDGLMARFLSTEQTDAGVQSRRRSSRRVSNT
jgi:hypothetical protein